MRCKSGTRDFELSDGMHTCILHTSMFMVNFFPSVCPSIAESALHTTFNLRWKGSQANHLEYNAHVQAAHRAEDSLYNYFSLQCFMWVQNLGILDHDCGTALE